MQDMWGHKHSYSATGNEPWSGLQPSSTLWNNLQPHSLKKRLWITANIITEEGMWMGSKNCAKFLNCWCRRILFLLCNNYVGFLQLLFSSLFDWIMLWPPSLIFCLDAKVVQWWSLKQTLLTSQAVKGVWLHMSCYGRFRGEWIYEPLPLINLARWHEM